MEKYKLFIDCDDVIVSSSPLIQRDVENNTRFKSIELINRESLLKMLRYFRKKIDDKTITHEEIKMLSEALKFELGVNDVIRGELGDINIFDKLKNLCDLAEHDKEMFLESRDAYLEHDNLNPNGGVVNYDKIYQKENMTTCASVYLKWLYDSGMFSDIYEITSQNGLREDNAKHRLNIKEFPFIQYESLRFHETEHVDGERRGRSSKAKYVMKKFNLPSLEKCVLIDDSITNINDWITNNGIGLLYKPLSLEERKAKKFDNYFIDTKSGIKYVRIFSLNALEIKEAIDNYNNILSRDERKKLNK